MILYCSFHNLKAIITVRIQKASCEQEKIIKSVWKKNKTNWFLAWFYLQVALSLKFKLFYVSMHFLVLKMRQLPICEDTIIVWNVMTDILHLASLTVCNAKHTAYKESLSQ